MRRSAETLLLKLLHHHSEPVFRLIRVNPSGKPCMYFCADSALYGSAPLPEYVTSHLCPEIEGPHALYIRCENLGSSLRLER